MRFIEHHKVLFNIFATVHRVIELIAENLGCADNDGSLKVLFSIAG
jgi:hypothetical protein